MLCAVYTLWNLAASTNGFFMPYVYEHLGKLSNAMSLFLTALNFAVCILTTFIFMYTGDKFNRRKVFGIFSGLGAVSYTHLDVYKRQGRHKVRQCWHTSGSRKYRLQRHKSISLYKISREPRRLRSKIIRKGWLSIVLSLIHI